MVALYGIKNCDSVKKARKWLEQNGVDYRFCDLREDGLEEAVLLGWLAKGDVAKLVNRRSTSWKNLPVKTRELIDTLVMSVESSPQDKSICRKLAALLLENPLLIKRPVAEFGRQGNQGILVGFNEQQYRSHFG